MDAQSLKTVLRAGEYGDACSATSKIVLAAAAIAARLDFIKLPAGTELQEVILINDALGADTTLSIGELFASATDGTTSATSLGAAAATSTAGRRESAFHPRVYDAPVTITATIAGAAATGTVTAIVKYRFIGNK